MRRESDVVGYGLFIPKVVVAVAALMILTLVSPAAAQSFTDPVTYTLEGENPGRAATGDLDGDGDADIAIPTYVSGFPGYVEVLLDLGSGSSAAPTAYGVGNEPTSVAVADLDGDGDLDLAVANRGDGTVSVLANRGDGTFEAAVDHAAGSSPFVVVADDLDGDGLADLAVTNTYEVSWLANNGDGTFAAPQGYTFGDSIVGLDIGAMEGDTDLDLVVLEKRGGTTSTLEAWVTVLWNDGLGTFESSPRYEGGSWSDAEDYDLHPSVDALALGDVDSNGYLDVLIGANTGWGTLPPDGSPLGRVHVLANSAGDLMPAEHRGSCHDDSPQLDTGDLDGDGDLDVVTGSVYFLNDGTGFFGDPQSHGGEGKYVTVDDLYPDGLPDLVLPQDPYSVQVLFQDDVCPGDPNKTNPGQCGCGQPDTDSDADGVADCLDECPGEPDTDSDGDRVVDCLDLCPDDPGKVDPGLCGCGMADVDSDGDGVLDCHDVCQGFDDTLDCNSNGVPDGCDILGGPFENEQKLTASDGAWRDEFGSALSIHGDTIVVGSRYDDDLGYNSGSAYVYRYDTVSGLWVEEQKLTASDGAASDDFGNAVSIHGDTIVVGADHDDDLGYNSGSAYVYRYDTVSGLWVEQQKLTASDGAWGDEFGSALSIHGDTIVVGARYGDGLAQNSGSVYVYRYDAVTGGWVEEQKLTASDGAYDDSFGSALSNHGDTIVVGAYGDDDLGTDSGSVYVYRYDVVSGQWIEEQKLTASDGAGYDYFGSAVSIHGDTIVVGAPYNEDDPVLGTDAGSAYVFRHDAVSGQWVEQSKLTASDGAARDYFGNAVSIHGDTIAVAAPYDDDRGADAGSAYVYRYDAVSGLWVEEQKLTASDGATEDYFGIAVSIHGDTIVAGSHQRDDLGTDSGAVYTFEGSGMWSDCDLDGVPDDCQPDTDLDGVIDACDDCPTDPGKTDPGICGCGTPDTDSDGDCVADCFDQLPGQPDDDSDGDGVADCLDQCPGEPDTDLDGDGVADCIDQCPTGPDNPLVFTMELCPGDPNKLDPGVCGCGVPDDGSDEDTDGVMDCVDVCPGNDDTLDCNGNSVPDGCEIESGLFEEDRKLTASDGFRYDNFGNAISIHGDLIAVGANGDDDQGSSSGSVYVYRYDAVSGGWVEEQKLTASDGAEGDSFGSDVSIHGDTIVVGANGDDDQGGGSGSAYLYRYDAVSGGWVEEQKLTASDGAASDYFGNAVSVHGDTIVVGSLHDDDRGFSSGSAYVYRYDAVSGNWVEEQKLTASDGAADDRFGQALSIHDDTIVVGASRDDDSGNSAESAYVYRYDAVTGGWVEEQKLTASDSAEGDLFGSALSIHGDTIVVGADHDDDRGSRSGSAYVYRYDAVSGLWVEEQKLSASDGARRDRFGRTVSIHGDTIVVGARSDDDRGTNSGSAYVYHYDTVSGQWVGEQKLTASDGAGHDLFGSSVSIHGDLIAVGANGDDDQGSWSGSAYTFEHSVSPDCDAGGVPDECQPDTDLDGLIDACDDDDDGDGTADLDDGCPLDANKIDPGQCGCGQPDIDSDGDGVADCIDQCPGQPDIDSDGDGVADCIDQCPGEPDTDSDGDGAADCVDLCHGFDDTVDCNVNGVPDGCDIQNGPFEHHDGLTASDGEPSDEFGKNVAIDGDAFVVAAPREDDRGDNAGAVYVYRHDAVTGGWFEEQKLTASDGGAGDYFGRYLSIHGETIAVGAWGDDDRGDNAGAVYVYRYDGSGTWNQEQKLTASDGDAHDEFGEDVSIHGDTIAIGAWADEDRGYESGSVYVYRYDAVSETWVEEQKLTASDGAPYDRFGYRVSIHGDTIVVGALQDDDLGYDSGSAYVYRYDAVTGSWVEEQKLTASDGEANDIFGLGVSIHGDTIVVGAPYNDDPVLGTDAGSAYVFRHDAVSGQWVEQSKLTASDGDIGDLLGEGVSTDGGTIVVGAAYDNDPVLGDDVGSVYVYRYDTASGLWVEDQKLTAPDGEVEDKFGYGVAVDAGTIVAGSYGRNDRGTDSGAVYTFDRPGTASDCDRDGVPDECQPDTDLDGRIDACDCAPDNVYCSTDCTDGDIDGYCVTSDCDDASAGSWATPGEVAGLRFGAGTKDDLSWDEPAEPGGDAPRYDTVRSDFADDFGAATCIESDDASDRMAIDVAVPDPGMVFHYLVRAENDCPAGQGTLGEDSQGVERSAPICP